MLNRIFVLFLIACLIATASGSQTHLTKKKAKDIQLTQSSAGFQITFVLRDEPPADPETNPWGTSGTPPFVRHVRAAWVSCKGKSSHLSISAVSDLWSLDKVTVLPGAKGKFSVKIRGGDAHGAYTGTLTFHNEILQAREIHHGEFREEFWERTEYHFVKDEGQ